MLVSRFLIILSMFCSIQVVAALDIDYAKLSLQLQQIRKVNHFLQIYVKLLEHYDTNFGKQSDKQELIALQNKALDLLDYNKRLSRLSTQYHHDNCQESLREMHQTLEQRLESMDDLINRIKNFLSNSQDNHLQQTGCEASQKFYKLHQRRSGCLEIKDYDCFASSFAEGTVALDNYNQCLQTSLQEKFLKL